MRRRKILEDDELEEMKIAYENAKFMMPHYDWEENENLWDEYSMFGRAVKLNLKDLNRKHEYELDCILRSWEKERPYAMQKIEKNPFSPFRYAVYNNTIEVPIKQ